MDFQHLNLWPNILVSGMSIREGRIMVMYPVYYHITKFLTASTESMVTLSRIGLHEFYYSSNYILILNIFRSNELRGDNKNLKTYQEYLPSEVYILDPAYFQKSKIKAGKDKIFKANKADMSCNTV